MPIYEYKCTACGNIFEKLIMSKSEKKPICPACKANKSERVLSTVSIGNTGASGSGCSPNVPSGFS